MTDRAHDYLAEAEDTILRYPYGTQFVTDEAFLLRGCLAALTSIALTVYEAAPTKEAAPPTPGFPPDHDCRDCPKHGGIGFACNHLVRGRYRADSCLWCRDNGYNPDEVIQTRDAKTT